MRVEIIRRDHSRLEVTLTDIDDNPIDLTDGTLFFTVKKRESDPDSQAVIKKQFTEFDDPTNGITEIILTPDETNIPPGNYYYDVQFISQEGITSSARRGFLLVVPDITERVN